MTEKHDIIPAGTVVVATPGRRMSPVVEALVAQATSPDVLRELLAVQREWEAGEAKKAYVRARVALEADIPAVIGHDSKVDYTGDKGRVHYRFASLASAVSAVAPILAQHGFALSWETSNDDRNVRVTARLSHCDGHSEECTLQGPPDPKGGKTAVQAIASSVTYLKRQTLLAILGIATADMKDPEPPAPRASNGVDKARNLKAAAAIRRAGLEVGEAEAMLGRKVQEWTIADLDVIREWIKPKTPPKEPEVQDAEFVLDGAEEREPGADENEPPPEEPTRRRRV